MDSKSHKNQRALLSRQKRVNGSQVCANYGNGCNFPENYFCIYSPEGLCYNCQLLQFPERYHGCCFCREAIDLGLICYGCKEGFEEWALNLFYYTKSDKSTSCSTITSNDETYDWEIWKNVNNGIHSLTHDYVKTQIPFIVQQDAKYNDE